MTGGSSRTVLVVDDEQAIRLLCRVNLELDGYVVLEAGTLDEARAHLDRIDVDAVLPKPFAIEELSHLVDELAARTGPAR